MQKIFLLFLASLARMLIQIKKPYVIGVTGTVGKTTITTHIATLLSREYGDENVYISPYHYNGEFGLPLSIIRAKSPGRNPFGWISVFCLAFIRIFQSYPRYLILEYGIDHPGEMEYLISIVQPDIAIISPIAPNHLEQFGTLDLYRREKLLLANSAKHLISYEAHRQYIDREAQYYSMGGMSDIDAAHTQMHLDGVSADVFVQETSYRLSIPAFGAYQIENILPLYGVARILGIDPENIGKCSYLFLPEPGRSSILPGIHNSVIIDGSYNGGFESICRGIDSVRPFSSTHRIFFLLGDMRELGSHSEAVHTELMQYIADTVDAQHDVSFFLVGPLMQKYIYPGLAERYPTYHHLSSREMGKVIASRLTQEVKPTIIYVKGSQNTIFLEESIISFLGQRKDVVKLCRQSSDWKRKKDAFFASLK